MFTTCGKPKLTDGIKRHLEVLGRAIHGGIQPFVFDNGFVSLVEQRESEVKQNEESQYRSEARQRAGQRKSGRQRPSGQAKSFRSRAVEETYGTGFRLLAQHYKALSFEKEDGLWVAVKAKPLGPRGPQAHFIVALPFRNILIPKAWAFEHIGSSVRRFPLKHTNFPDASICAFTFQSKAWNFEDGLLPLIDHYSLWAVKSWHRSVFGWWPGDQVGECALYRRNEFVAQEKCGCGSGRSYLACHQFADLTVSEQEAQNEFRNKFLVDYQNREVPDVIMQAARRRWGELPFIASLYKT